MAQILIVDDEADIREMLRDALLLHGHEIDLAESSDAAIALAKEKPFDIAVIDYVLPGMRGLDLLVELHKLNPFLRAIIISGQIDHDDLNANELEQQLKERIAADRYLPKPVSGPDLLHAIDDLYQPGAKIDWKKVAGDAVATQKVKSKDVRALDRTMKKSRRKPTK
jgi:CheY-like chemotaxis protein